MDKLLNYLPPFMQEYKEMQEIMGTEQQFLEPLEVTMMEVLNNNFILTANEQGIRKYEKLLNIKPVPEDTLETRRMKVLSRWNNFVPYTWRVLIKRMDFVCGNHYKLLPDFNNYQLGIRVWLEGCGQADALDHLLRCMMPANILLDSRNEIPAETDTTIYAVAWTTDCEVQEMMDYYHDDFYKKDKIFASGGTVEAEMLETSDAVMNEKFDGNIEGILEGMGGFGGAVIEYTQFETVQDKGR